MSKMHGLIPISNPDRSLPPRNPYPSLPINPSTIPKRPPIILIVKFHSIGATFTRNFVNGSFSKVDPLRIPYWNRKFARRIARFGRVLRGATRDARDKSARVQRGKRWTTVQGLFSPGRRRTLGGRGLAVVASKSVDRTRNESFGYQNGTRRDEKKSEWRRRYEKGWRENEWRRQCDRLIKWDYVPPNVNNSMN